MVGVRTNLSCLDYKMLSWQWVDDLAGERRRRKDREGMGNGERAMGR